MKPLDMLDQCPLGASERGQDPRLLPGIDPVRGEFDGGDHGDSDLSLRFVRELKPSLNLS